METDRPTSAVLKHLNGYNLPPDSLYEIRALYLKRFQSPFSNGLSNEGRLAMQQVLQEDMPTQRENTQEISVNKQKKVERPRNAEKGGKRKHRDTLEKQKSRTISFSETFEKKSTERLDGDITDKNFNAENQRKKAIGGKIENAMETIEIVKHGEPEKPVDGDALKLNSVEKCLVWMEVNGGAHTEEPVSASSGTPLAKAYTTA